MPTDEDAVFVLNAHDVGTAVVNLVRRCDVVVDAVLRDTHDDLVGIVVHFFRIVHRVHVDDCVRTPACNAARRSSVKVARPQRRGGLLPIIESIDVDGDVGEKTGGLFDYVAAEGCDAASARGERTDQCNPARKPVLPALLREVRPGGSLIRLPLRCRRLPSAILFEKAALRCICICEFGVPSR